jgi:farnesol dehydrogenase
MALGPSDGAPITENDARRVQKLHNDYERTKYLGDQAARRLMQEGHPVYILYPGIIYGPGNMTDGNIVAKNLIPFLNGMMPFGLPIKAWSYVYVRDVVGGFVAVIENDPPSRRYILGGDNHDGESFYRVIQEVSGKRPPVANLPMALAKLAGYGEYLLAALFGREPKLLTHEVVDIYKHSWAYDSSLAQKELGYRVTPLIEGMSEMIRWMKKAGYVKA